MSVDLGDTRAQRFRENTVRSLVQAARAGASFVEFDVQVRAPTCCRTCQLTKFPSLINFW